jgi:hypothetical protein
MAICELLDPTGYLTQASGWSYFADLLFGSNGSFPWASELYVGPDSETAAYGSATWDPDLSDGFDSGQVGVSFDANLTAGTATLSTSNETSSPVTYTGVGTGTIGSVEIRAKVQTAGEVAWSDISIAFWHGDTMGETLSVGAGAVANLDAPGSAEEQRLVVTPSDLSYDRVTVSGTLQMTAGPDIYPDWADLFGQILVMPAA